MYNESGDCLDPKIMQELTASVGKCKIELPKMDYSVIYLYLFYKPKIFKCALLFAGVFNQTVYFK